MRRNPLVMFDMHQDGMRCDTGCRCGRFTRLTNAFSKKSGSHAHGRALYGTWYSYVKSSHSAAMAAGLGATLWEMKDLAEMADAAAPKPGPRGPYKKTVEV